MSLFTGSGVALVTPFHGDGSVHYEKLTELIEFQLKNNTDALIITSITGEASTLAADEHIETIRVAVHAARAYEHDAREPKKRVPVIASTGGNYTEYSVNLCARAQAAGADGLMLAAPYYNKATPKGLAEHFAKLASSADLPIIIYNAPGRTGLNIAPKTIKALTEISNIVGINEASGNIVQIAEIVELCGEELDIYAGNDDYVVPVLSLGGKGVISDAANIIPGQMHEMTVNYLNGAIASAVKLQIGILELSRALSCEISPIPVKAALNIMGFNVGGYRLPLTSMEPENEALLHKAMKNYRLIQ